MELWIRSQDGERLTKATDLRVYYASKENVYAIEDCDDLGYYKTKERALEVLDEIQSILILKMGRGFTGEGIINVENGAAIFKMPKE